MVVLDPLVSGLNFDTPLKAVPSGRFVILDAMGHGISAETHFPFNTLSRHPGLDPGSTFFIFIQ